MLVGYFAASHRQDVDRGARLPEIAAGKGAFEKAVEVFARGKDWNAGGGDACDGAIDRLIKALIEEGDVEKANRIMAGIDLNELLAPQPPHLSEVLAAAWFGIFLGVVVNTLLCVALGFLFGLYPGASTVAMGTIVGAFLPRALHGEGGWSLSVWSVWILSVWLVLILVNLLSAAIGFDMARYIAQRRKGEWFVGRLRMGLEAWGTAVAPAALVAMILLAIGFAIVIVISGDPVLR